MTIFFSLTALGIKSIFRNKFIISVAELDENSETMRQITYSRMQRAAVEIAAENYFRQLLRTHNAGIL